jgi:uncharacterized protein (DUF4415 family)
MKSDRYTNAPPEIEMALDNSLPVDDFLPPPSKLVKKIEKERVTIMLDKVILDFFRVEAEKYGVAYQTMINNLLGEYANKYKRT